LIHDGPVEVLPMHPPPSAAHVAAETRIRRALRVTTNGLTVLSLLLSLTAVALCMRSYRVRDIGRVAGALNEWCLRRIEGRAS
jgi:hypothetical protein